MSGLLRLFPRGGVDLLPHLREFLLAVDFGRAAVFGGEAFEEGAPVYEARLVDDLVDRELRGREQLFGLGQPVLLDDVGGGWFRIPSRRR